MKNWIIVILFLFISRSITFSCGYYPYGEDIRYNLLKPNYIGFKGMDPFNYSSNCFWGETEESTSFTDNYKSENIHLWFYYFKGEFNENDLKEAVYHSSSKELRDKKSDNKFILFLQESKNKEILNYLIFAKKCSSLNSFFSDPWEDFEIKDKWKRKRHIKKALYYAEKTKNEELKRRYAYLAIRMAYYNSDKERANSIFSKYFNVSIPKNVLDYWALHFKLHFDESSARKNVEVANVFYHSVEKRYAVHFLYDTTFNFNESLNQTKNNEEKGALYLLKLATKADKSLNEIKSFYSYLPNSPELEFLILRELNKLENWILTPHYTLFEPSMSDYYDYESDLSTNKIMIERMNSDRLYAKEVYEWMNSIDSKITNKFESWQTMKLYIQFMSGEKRGLLHEVLKNRNVKYENNDLNFFNNMLYSLVYLNSFENPNLENETVQKTLMSASKKSLSQFIFTLGRELEFKDNTTEAALLYSKMNDSDYGNVYWKSHDFSSPYYSDYFADFFFYLDAQYTPKQVVDLILSIEKKEIKTEFDSWKFTKIITYKDRLYDLLGTKYVRLDDLENALITFKKVNDSLWKSDGLPYKFYLNANPFYTNLYNEHRVTIGDTISYTKPEIIQKLINYKNKINSDKEENKAYYCFQVANCYLNMTTYGNSWMMRRYYWSNYPGLMGLVDDQEYLNCNLAKKYYLEAEKYSRNDKFAALSLRMAGRCEEYKDDYLSFSNNFYDENSTDTQEENKYFKQLKNKYPDHYEPLISNCLSFTEYYKSGYSKR